MDTQGCEIIAGITVVVEECTLDAFANDFVFIVKQLEKGSEMSLVGHAARMASSGRSAKEKGRRPGWMDSVELSSFPLYEGSGND